MTFISYAQNFEDVMLWRALKHVERGFWIDVGAAHPDEYSITRAFSDRGWRGINIEANPSFAVRIAGARPRDVTLAVAVGVSSEPVRFFEVVGTGLSTTHGDIADRHRAAGFEVREHETPSRRLATICDEHASAEIHFLKVDVEGSEAEVLAGADFARHRPWIVLVEATKPLSQEEAFSEWEPLLLSANYRFAWFDGLNRFYIAAEHWEALSSAFATPPNVFDDFIRAGDTEQLNRIVGAETRAGEAEARAGQAELRALKAETQAMQAGARANQAETRAARVEARAVQAEATARREAARTTIAVSRAEAAETCLAHIHTSTSWRLTAPIRAAREAARGRLGLALVEAGMAPTRVERLKRSAGEDGGHLKKAARIAFYAATRVAVRLPGSRAADAWLRRIAPGGWRWLHQRSDAYLASALQTRVASHRVIPSHAIGSAALASSPIPLSPAHRLTLVVHQFHSGSAPGDAITNSMLLIRSWLRGQGYESEIFVEHRHPALADDLLEIGDLPQHDDYVLIVHHSMGYDALDRILALPARKILMYHNITPPEFLSDFPVSVRYAEIGRQQLGIMRPHMYAALADSDYNALELRAFGYTSPAACPLLFDVDAIRARAGSGADAPRPGDQPFTILFVGRIVASKGQADLVDAFATFRGEWDKPARLVLVGRSAGDEAEYPTEIRRRIALHGLDGDVILTGPVSDEALHGWYQAADLYVSLSHHEGFGVPLIEAMAHGVPVLAWPAGAVPYTLSGASVLLQDRAPEAVGYAMLQLARDPDRRARIVAGQREVLGRFRLERHTQTLMQALLSAGAAPPASRTARDIMAANLRVTVTGHISGSYSLAIVNRTTALALEARQPGRIRILPWENGPATTLDGVPTEELGPVSELISRPPAVTGPELVLSQHYPIHVPQDPRDGAAVMVFWEESLLPAETVARINGGFRGVLAPSSFVAKALIDSGVSLPIAAAGYAPSLDAFFSIGEQRSSRPRPIDEPFTFVHVSSCFPRKGVDALLAAYAAAFRRGDSVRLVIKGFPNPHNDVAEQIAALRMADPELPEITFVNEDLAGEALLDLYRTADVMVLPARGEGFNMPAAEAVAAGIPLIVTGFGGHLDFCTPDEARFIGYRFAPSRSHIASAGSVWVEPDRDDLVRALREAFQDLQGGGGRFAGMAERARAALVQRLDAAAWADRAWDMMIDILLAAAPRPMRLAWVSTWDVRCGIAEYSRFLTKGMGDAGAAMQTTIICDSRTAPSSVGKERVRVGWTITDVHTAETLAREIAVLDADVVVIQHQPGLIEWQQLRHLLLDRRVAGRVVTVTLHAAPRIMEIPEEDRLATLEVLRGIARVVVHQVADLNLLKDLGLTANVTLFPQGAPANWVAPAARALSNEDAPVIGCFGFLAPGKGIGRLIEAASILKARWPGLQLKLLNALHPYAPRTELTRCQALAESLGLADAIAWETEFLPLEECQHRLSQCDLVVLAYDESKESSSAAIRVALASGAPVAVTPVAIFEEVIGAVHRFESLDAEAVAQGVDALLRNRPMRRHYQVRAAAWLEEHAWDSLGRRFRGMLQGLRVNTERLS
ncbi:FkbM family methyltransferase [Roseomonas hellenica]|uniref:FkbM family methyltransferase n=1 Tax=Plastoroseomonas hellenica TaxID=2687306 RepID=A0ABS5F1W2_9PROT|nr:FkbM family methyltransferase [Plastoroseomonas hellenica]